MNKRYVDLRKVLTIGLVFTINASMVVSAKENVKKTDLRNKHNYEIDKENADNQNGEFQVGNSSAKILNGGLSAVYGDKYIYATDDGIRMVKDEESEVIAADIASYINILNDDIYYVTFENENYVIKVIEMATNSQKVIHTSKNEIKYMYVVNDDILFESMGKIYKINLDSNVVDCICNEGDIESFIPTRYGLVIEKQLNGNKVVKIGEKEINNISAYYVDEDYLIVDIEGNTYQVKLQDAFNNLNSQKTNLEDFSLYGKVSFDEIFVQDAKYDETKHEFIADEDSSKYVKYTSSDEVDSQERNNVSRGTYSLRTADVTYSQSAATLASESSVSTGQKNIVKRARQMVEIRWTPAKDIKGWKGATTFSKGTTYVGVPYGQCVDRGSWIGYNTSLDAFIGYVKNSNSLLYTSSASYSGNIAPYYSNDCSTFLSYCWGLPSRETTSTLTSDVKMTLVTKSNNTVLQIGDCLNAKGNHVVLITDKKYNSSGELVAYDIMEQTPPKARKKSNVSLAEIDKYFDEGYIAYRYDNRGSVAYQHCCSVSIDGDKCSNCNGQAAASELKITDYTYPTTLNIGQAFSLKGAITSNYKITNVTVGVYTTSGTAKITATATPNAYSYNVSGVDAKITFNTLPAGTYVYKVVATDSKGTKTLVNKNFTVKDNTASTMTIKDYTYPTTLSKGQVFLLKGLITSNYKITKVTIGVYTTTGTAKITASATPNAYSYNVSGLDAKITFNTLPAGTYLYKVIATDAKGTQTLVTRTFIVK